MIVKEENEFTTERDSFTFLQRKTITYDSDPINELQDMIDDGWILEKIEVSNYYQQNPFHTVTMKKYSMENSPSFIEIPIPPAEELRHQISTLFEDRWRDI